jgi:hypothetical protein
VQTEAQQEPRVLPRQTLVLPVLRKLAWVRLHEPDGHKQVVQTLVQVIAAECWEHKKAVWPDPARTGVNPASLEPDSALLPYEAAHREPDASQDSEVASVPLPRTEAQNPAGELQGAVLNAEKQVADREAWLGDAGPKAADKLPETSLAGSNACPGIVPSEPALLGERKLAAAQDARLADDPLVFVYPVDATAAAVMDVCLGWTAFLLD